MKNILSILTLCILFCFCNLWQVMAQELFENYKVPEWFGRAKFGIWLHWGPQTLPLKGGGWYARHMYVEPDSIENEYWGKGAWEYHRVTFGHQSEFGYKDVCNLWRTDQFDADRLVKLYKSWGARYVAIIANHHDNFDLFKTTIHPWNSLNIGPKRDLVGEFAEAARNNHLKWMASVHAARAKKWFATSVASDSKGFLKGILYDGNLTKADGKGKWWEGYDPQQFYAHNYADFEKELNERLIELVDNYEPDILYFDDSRIPDFLWPACKYMYAKSMKKYGTVQAAITVKSKQVGTITVVEKGVADGIQEQPWQTETTLADDWFNKPNDDGSSRLLHDARSLKEMLVDVVSKRGNFMVNVALNADGSIPQDQFYIMEDVGNWVVGNSEAIYDTEPWKIYGEGGDMKSGHFNERGINSRPWDYKVIRFTRDRNNKILYAHILGDPSGKKITISCLSPEKGLFTGKIRKISLIGSLEGIEWNLNTSGLDISMPEELKFRNCNVLKIETTGL